MKKSVISITMMLFITLAFAFSFQSCNMSGNKDTNKTEGNTDTTRTIDTARTPGGGTVDTNKHSSLQGNEPGRVKGSEITDAPAGGTETSSSQGTMQQDQKNAKTGQTATWDVPAAEKNKKNPIKSSAESIDNGKTLYAKNCASCHGKSGAGDGPRASTLKTKMIDFKSASLKSQTDGELYYKTSQGKGEMPSYAKKLSSNDIWDVVNYLKSMGGGKS